MFTWASRTYGTQAPAIWPSSCQSSQLSANCHNWLLYKRLGPWYDQIPGLFRDRAVAKRSLPRVEQARASG